MVVFDVDGVLVPDQSQRFFEFVRRVYGLTWDYRLLLATGNWQLVTGAASPRVTELFTEYWASDEHIPDSPMPGAQLVLRSLSLKQCHVVTARSRRTAEATKFFLEQTYGRFSSYTFESLGQKAQKIAECDEVSVVIEDNLTEARAIKKRHPEHTVILHPVRWVQRPTDDSGVVFLEAERWVTPELSDEAFVQVVRQAWSEIGEIIAAAPAELVAS